MKKYPSSIVALLAATILICSTYYSTAQNIFPSTGSAGIGTTTPNASSVLDMVSTTKGMLVPRMTKAQRDAIATPATGLFIYQTNSAPGFYYYSGTLWTAVSTKGANTSLSNLGITSLNSGLFPNVASTLDIGSSSLRWKDIYPTTVKFPDATIQTTAFIPYTGGTGINISGTTLSLANSGVTAGSYGSSGLIPVITIDATGRITSASTVSSGSGANKNLSNLGTTSINKSLIPSTDNATDLGSSALGWKDVYVTGSIYLDGIKFIDDSGTDNTFIGNTGNVTNTGSSNTMTGKDAGASNTTGFGNSFFGKAAGVSNTEGYHNSFFGQYAGASNTTGLNNTASGFDALGYNTTGYFNTASGFEALYYNTTGYYNIASGVDALYFNTIGHDNSATGIAALYHNTTGNNNSAYGNYTLYYNTTGYSNTANGFQALRYNTSGYGNTAAGDSSLFSNTTGNYNSANGFQALNNNTTGSRNIASGYNALYSNTTGYSNTATGGSALYSNTTGFQNTATGGSALYSNTTGSQNSATGVDALSSNTTGSQNTANGYFALSSNTTGSYNTSSGTNALFYNISGSNNTAHGYQALYSTSTGVNNTATGFKALYSNTGDDNTANGVWSLYSNTSGVNNTAIGVNSLYYNTTGNNNTADGEHALFANTTGINNTAVGKGALSLNTTGSDNIAIGFNAGDCSACSSLNNTIAIGYNESLYYLSNATLLGNSSTVWNGGNVPWSTYSDTRIKKNVREDVKGLDFITRLRPVTYYRSVKAMSEITGGKMTQDYPEKYDIEKIKFTGFLAQEVERAAKEANYDFSGITVPKNSNELYTLSYEVFVVPLVKAVQELSKQNDSLKETVTNQQSSIVNQQKINHDLQKQLNDLKTLVLSVQQCSPCNTSGANAQTYNTIITDGAALEQNVPNPFTHNTSIGYTLPQKFYTAQIIITDKAGKTLKTINVSGSGKGSLNVDASTLSSGAYQYSLIIDGKLIGTKQMVLTK